MRIIAHRSGPTVYPEQTIASAKLALENNADLVEIDVRFTADCKLAICHDDDAMRVFGVNKNISNMTETEFLALRHKENPDFCSHTFEDYLKCGIAPLLIHIKQDAVLDELLKLIDKYDYADKVVIGAQSIKFVESVKKRKPEIKVLAFMPSASEIEKFAAAGVDYIRLWQGWLNEENINLVRKTGKELWVMTSGNDVGVPEKEQLLKVIALKPDGILINDVTLIKEN